MRGDRFGAALCVAQNDQDIAKIRIELDLVRRAGKRATVPRNPDAVDQPRFESIAVATTIIRVYVAGQAPAGGVRV